MAMAMDGSNVEELVIGCLLSIKTTLGDQFHGQVITFDRPSNILVLQDGLKPGSCRNIRILKANYIKELSYLGQGEDTLDLKKCYLDLNSLRAREELAIRLPVHWDKTVIVVMNEVRVCSPYLSESVTGGTAAANERVKKVIDFERKKLQSRSSSQMPVAAA